CRRAACPWDTPRSVPGSRVAGFARDAEAFQPTIDLPTIATEVLRGGADATAVGFVDRQEILARRAAAWTSFGRRHRRRDAVVRGSVGRQLGHQLDQAPPPDRRGVPLVREAVHEALQAPEVFGPRMKEEPLRRV